MQIFSQVTLFVLGVCISIFLIRFNRLVVFQIAFWFWKRLFFKYSKWQILSLKFLTLSWILFPWFVFFTIFALQRKGNVFSFMAGVVVLGLVRIFNHQNWKNNFELFENWLRDQGGIKEVRPQLSPQHKLSARNIASNFSNHHVQQMLETNYFDIRSILLLLVLGWLASDLFLLEHLAFLDVLWFAAGLALPLGTMRTEVDLNLGWFVRNALVALGLCFFEVKLQSICLTALIWTSVCMWAFREAQLDLAWELRPRHMRRASGELQMVDSHKIIKARAVREFGDTLVLGRPYKALFLIRDMLLSPSLRWLVVRLDFAAAASLLLFFILRKAFL